MGAAHDMKSLAIAFAIAVSGLVLYHTVMKRAPTEVSPYALIGIAYIIGLVSVLVIGIVSSHDNLVDFKSIDVWQSGVGLGLAVVAIEVGYLLAYRQGLPISTGGLSVLAVATVILVPIGIIVFSEDVNAKTVIGCLLAILGVWLMRS